MITTKTCSTCEHFPNDHHCVGCVWDEDKGENTKWELKKNPIVIERAVLDKIRAKIIEENECAYADFDKYKVDYLGVDSRYVEDELPYDDFRYGMERCIEIIDKYRKGIRND